ncbi:MAG TPA: DMT family transporter [Dongiaceae bacterium]|nr:DMT family transporter [Dongiaceae bacterium]
MPFNATLVWSLVIATTFFWGSNFNAAHAIAGEVAPLTAAAERFALAVVVLLLVRVWQGRAESQLTGREQIVLVLLGLVGVFGFNAAFFIALHTTSALNAALIMALSPLLTTLLSAAFLGTGLPARQLVGILIAFAGVTLVITGGRLNVVHLARGDVWMLLACFTWSLYSVLLKRFASRVPSLQQARWTIASGAVALVTMALWVENPLPVITQQSFNATLVLVYMSICGTVLAYIFWLQGVEKLGPQRAAVAFNLVPVFTLLVNLALGHWPSAEQFGGLVLVIVGVLVATGALQHWMQSRPSALAKS